MRQSTFIGAALLALCATLPARAQEPADRHPSRPLRLIVPYTPGGSADVLGRAIGQHLSQAWGQPVIIDNKPGADGLIGAEAVAKAPADGYTLLYGPNALYSILPAMHRKAAVDARRDLLPVAAVSIAPMVVAVPASLPVHDPRELVAYAKAHPGQMSFGSAGNSSLQRMIGENVNRLAGTGMVHVPYKGTSQAVADLAGGQIQVLYGSLTSIEPVVKGGRARVIAITSDRRFPDLPGYPSLAEGIPGWRDFSTFQGIFAPRGLPAPLADRIAAEVGKALRSPAFVEKLKFNAFAANPDSPREFKARLDRDQATLQQVMEAAHIEPED